MVHGLSLVTSTRFVQTTLFSGHVFICCNFLSFYSSASLSQSLACNPNFLFPLNWFVRTTAVFLKKNLMMQSEICRFGNQELPLLDRDFTSFNLQDLPILTRIDRAFINSDSNFSLPNTTLHSIPRVTSDHSPLKTEASTTVPESKIFWHWK
jgi:hypothetical protein